MATVEHLLYGRKVSLTVALPTRGSLVEAGDITVTFDKTRITFEVEQNLNKDPNIANIVLYNLNTEQRAFLSEKGVKIVLSAGYESNFDILFTGDLKKSISHKDGTDWLTSLECKDGGRTIAHSSTRKSFKAGIKTSDVIKKLISDMELESSAGTKRVLAELKSEYTNGKVLSGNSANLLDKILVDHGMEWSIQNGRLQILRFGDVEDYTPFITLTKETGLIGSPEDGTPDNEKGPKRYKANSLLQPALFPGKLVYIKSILVDQTIKVNKVTHTGDNYGSEWYSVIEGFLWNR